MNTQHCALSFPPKGTFLMKSTTTFQRGSTPFLPAFLPFSLRKKMQADSGQKDAVPGAAFLFSDPLPGAVKKCSALSSAFHRTGSACSYQPAL